MFDLLKYNLRKIKSKSWQSVSKAAVYEKQTSVKGDYQDFLTSDYVSELTKRLSKDSKILDLGCGTGVLSLKLGELGYNITALDISSGMLGELEKKIGSLAIKTVKGDVFDLLFENKMFDGIITRWVLPHFDNWPLIINEATKYLKKDGIFVFDMTSKENYDEASKGKNIGFKNFGYNPYNEKAHNYYSSATIDELKLIAKTSNLEILTIIPNGFFRSNALFFTSLSEDDYKSFTETFTEYYKNENVASFIQWYDLSITKKLPVSLANTLTVVAKKI